MAINYIEMQKAPNGTAGACGCNSCRGLTCQERPRFFAGQLLTEAELNSEQAYVLAKNRLHNRYLHGSGIVCGLEVVCHDCSGWVRVKSGYALDPCGNDVIVCRDHDLNVLEEIRKYRAAQNKRDEGCRPWRTDESCMETEEHWCITLEYRETEARGVTPLQQGSKSGGGCGCQSTSAPASTRPAACEATRISEQYRLSVIPEPAACASARMPPAVRLAAFPFPGSILDALLSVEFQSLPLLRGLAGTQAANSLVGRVVALAAKLDEIVFAPFDLTDRPALVEMIRACRTRPVTSTAARFTEVTFPAGGGSLAKACSRFRRAVCDLYAKNPFRIRCKPLDCPPCNDGPTTGTPPNGTPVVVKETPATVSAERFAFPPDGPSTTNNDDRNDAFCCLVNALTEYVVEGLYATLLPPCTPEPCEERLIVACVTVKDDRVVDIDNHSCRRYTGSFPTRDYWGSTPETVPVAAELLAMLRNRAFVDQMVIDPVHPDPGTGSGDPGGPIPDTRPQA